MITVTFDTSALAAGVRRLGDTTAAGARTAARRAAEAAAADIAGRLRVRTGRLVRSVRVVAVDGGYGVSYGENVRYARPVGGPHKAVAAGIAGKPETFERAGRDAAAGAVARL